jgi:hypothetical protein
MNKSGLLSIYKMDAVKQQDGVLVEFPQAENADGSVPKFRLARISSNNVRYTKAMEFECRPYKREIELGALDKATDRKIAVKVFCQTILLGWENVKDAEGKDIPFGERAANQLLLELPDLYVELTQRAQDMSLFRQNELESDAKN